MIPAIGYASGLGGLKSGCRYGPSHIKHHLHSSSLYWKSIVDIDSQLSTPLKTISHLNTRLAKETYQFAKENLFFMLFGGDHSCAIGTWSGVAEAKREEGEIGLIWIDAHMDAHTLNTSETGNIHGMPLAALLGHGDPCFTHILSNRSKISPQNLTLIGTRSFEAGEEKLLNDLSVNVYNIDAVKEKGFPSVLEEAIAYVTKETI